MWHYSPLGKILNSRPRGLAGEATLEGEGFDVKVVLLTDWLPAIDQQKRLCRSVCGTQPLDRFRRKGPELDPKPQ
jgi:hypothetical protein